MRCHDEGDPRTSVPVFLALRGPGRPEGPGVPLPRRPPVRGRTAETRGGPRCVPGPTRRRAPPPPRRDPGPRPPALRAKALRRRGRAMIEVRRARIDLEAVVDSVRRDDAGAIVLFVGTVRSDEQVKALDYEVYRPMAIKSLTALAERAKDKFGLTDLSIVHRLGRVPVGGDSVAIACAAVHRAEAFAACAWVMDEVKRIVPIWKTEIADHPSRVRRRR